MRGRRFQPDHYPHRFLAGVQIGAEQLGHALFFFQRLQQLPQMLAILLVSHQIGHAFHVDLVRTFVLRQGALPIQLFERAHHAVIFAARLFHPARHFRPHRFHGVTAEIFIDVIGGKIKIVLRKVALHTQHAVADHARFGHHHGQNLVLGQPREINVIERIAARAAGSHGYAHAARNKREHVRGPLHKLLHVGHA